jgi:uncharacterized membrane protein
MGFILSTRTRGSVRKRPAAILFQWNTSLGRMIRNQAISGKSSVNSIIQNSGDIQLKDLPGEGTEIQLELTYAPPVGALGYAVVHYLGFDPKERGMNSYERREKKDFMDG